MSEDDEYRRSAAYDMVHLPGKVQKLESKNAELERRVGDLKGHVDKILEDREEERKTFFKWGVRLVGGLIAGMAFAIWNLLPDRAQDFLSMFTERQDR